MNIQEGDTAAPWEVFVGPPLELTASSGKTPRSPFLYREISFGIHHVNMEVAGTWLLQETPENAEAFLDETCFHVMYASTGSLDLDAFFRDAQQTCVNMGKILSTPQNLGYLQIIDHEGSQFSTEMISRRALPEPKLKWHQSLPLVQYAKSAPGDLVQASLDRWWLIFETPHKRQIEAIVNPQSLFAFDDIRFTINFVKDVSVFYRMMEEGNKPSVWQRGRQYRPI